MKTLGKTVLPLADGNDVTITVTEGSYGNDYNVHMDFSEDWSIKKNGRQYGTWCFRTAGPKRLTLDDLKPGVVIERKVLGTFAPPLTELILVLSDPIEVPDPANPFDTTHVVVSVGVERHGDSYRHKHDIHRSYVRDLAGYGQRSFGKVIDYHDFTSAFGWITQAQ